MPNERRASLAAHDLSDLHVELPERHRVEPTLPVPPAQAAILADERPRKAVTGARAHTNVVELYPSLAKQKRERLVGASFRLPLSYVERLEGLKKDGGANVSELVRDAIARMFADMDGRAT